MIFQKLLKTIPFNRLIVYIVILSLSPVFLLGYFYYKQNQDWKSTKERLYVVSSLSESQARKQFLNQIVKQTYSDVDQFYLETQLEPLGFLKKEREALENLLHNPSFTGNEAAEKRYAWISSSANALEFIQTASMQSEQDIQETPLNLAHPVEIDAWDLKELLTRIESQKAHKPQLFITDFKLQKKAHPNGNEVFVLNMKLLKREYS